MCVSDGEQQYVPVENDGSTQMCEVVWAWRISGIEALVYNYCDEIFLKANCFTNVLFGQELFCVLNWPF